jgi:hypothetical protein
MSQIYSLEHRLLRDQKRAAAADQAREEAGGAEPP